MNLDQCVAVCLVPLAIWVLVSGLDDLVLVLACLLGRLPDRRLPYPSESELNGVRRKLIAIFIPLWREHLVIGKMLEHNIAANRYRNYDIFIGVYPNDAPTLAAVDEIRNRFPRVHRALCPHDGPTSKGDCLNWIFQRMLLFEEEHGAYFDVVVIHDAEDLIHPEALPCINYYIESYDMVQIPVLPLPTPREWTHGFYCDEFAEFQTKDMPARQMLGGFIPSNGVGTGFSRNALERLAAANQNRIFEPGCLTEDYETGFRIHALDGRQIFVPIHRRNGAFIATREFFPRCFREAVRQRTRWIIGIAIQSWERHGWSGSARQLYWFWRDRKGLLGNLITPLSNVLFLYGVATWLWSAARGASWGLAQAVSPAVSWLLVGTLWLPFFHMSVRACCAARIYGWLFALGVPLRTLWGNYINCAATVQALRRYFLARWRGEPLVWLKTDHLYPSRAALMEHKRRLGEVLVGSRYISPADRDSALASKPAAVRLGEYLVRLGKLREEELYEALSLQQSLPLGRPDPRSVSRAVTRSLPAPVARRWKLLPFRVAGGELFVAGSELPSEQMSRDLRRFSSLEMRFHLITPADFEAMAREYLPPVMT
jgi:adsorption protein B